METPKLQTAQAVYSLKNFTVLLVDDYEFMQDLCASMLRAFGIGGIMVCNSGAEAIELLTITQSQARNNSVKGIDLILTDWMMPDGSGVELIDWVRNHQSDQIRFTPIMLLSAFTSEDIVGIARDHGASEALVKPISAEKMAARILAMIDNPRPFVKTATFFGPDRRRKIVPWRQEERRLMNTEQVVQHNERL
jgi:CheY-like chemotaxis protein